MSALNPAFLRHLKSLYPHRNQLSSHKVSQNPWYIVAAVAFSACNRPEDVPRVFQHVLCDLGDDEADQKLLLARKLRDALFKSGLTSGYPRAINSLLALHEVMPTDLRDSQTMRKISTSIEEHEQKGRELFCSIYGDTAGSVQGLLNSIYPDMGWFSNTIGYGLTYGFTDILTPLETSYTLVAALIAGDTPKQITWHLDGAQRVGATLEEVEAVRMISMEVATLAGVRWREGVPEVKTDLSSHRLS